MRILEPVRTLPRSLTLLLACVAVIGATWALVVPAWQAPDEPAHYGYVESVAAAGRLPGTGAQKTFSDSQDLAADRSNALQTAANPFSHPEWSRGEYDAWRRADGALGSGSRSDGGGVTGAGGNPARTNPPLYYVWETPAYLVTSWADPITRLQIMRLMSVLLLLIAVVATWKLAAELTSSRVLRLVAAATVGLAPMATFISASVNPDGMLIAIYALAMFATVRAVKSGVTPGRVAALGALAAAGVLTKATGYGLIPPIALALGIALWRTRPWSMPSPRALVAPLAFLVPVIAWLAYTRLADRPAVNQVGGGGGGPAVGRPDIPSLVSYVWQFYLPKLPFQTALPTPFPKLPAWEVWVKGGWGRFGWLEVVFPTAVYGLLLGVTGALGLGSLVALARRWRDSALLAPLLVLLTFAVCLLAGLHVSEYRVFRSQGNVLNQGRYLLPLLPLLGLAAAGTVSLLRGVARARAGATVVGLLFALQVFSLSLVTGRFYA